MQRKNRKMVFILTSISAIIGIMLATQLQSTLRPVHTETRNISELRSALQKELERHKSLLADISKYDLLFYQYKTSLDDAESLALMKEELARTRKLAGLASVEGPGVIVRIKDAPRPPLGVDSGFGDPLMPMETEVETVLVDEDLRWIINSLLINGGKAVALNGHRIVATTAIRNVNSDILVDGKTIKPPYEIMVLGDHDTIITGVRLDGVEDYFKFANKLIEFEKRDRLVIPAYDRTPPFKLMKPIKEPEKSKGDS